MPLRNTIFLTHLAILAFIALPPLKSSAAEKAETAPTVAEPAPGKTAVTALIPADRCTGDPKFLKKFGLSRRAVVDTTSTHSLGLVVTDVSEDGKIGRSGQHPSWTQAGALGRVQRDRDGNLYVYPAPSVSLEKNPIEKANIIYRVDSESGVMAPFVEIPKAAEASERNPFGLLALALDCEQNALYASTVFGSTATSEKDIIARIDLATKNITIVKRNIDALSLMIASDPRGKRLYAGAARDNVVVSYGIARDGALADDESVDIKLDEVQAAQDKRPRVLRVDGRGRMYVRAIPFEYTLAARTTIPITEMSFARNSTAPNFTLLEQKSSELRSAPAPQMNSPKPPEAVAAPKN